MLPEPEHWESPFTRNNEKKYIMMFFTVLVLILAYLLGSIPTAYIVTRLMTGKDIRRMGSGNVGGNNVFREVGLCAAIPVAILDVGKGSAAVAMTWWLLNISPGEPDPIVFLAALAAICGNIWSIFLKFGGGNGISTTFGVLALLMPYELLIVIVILLVLEIILRNLVLAVNLGLLSVLVTSWLLEKHWLYSVFSLVLLIILVTNFVPTVRIALTEAGGLKPILHSLFRRSPK